MIDELSEEHVKVAEQIESHHNNENNLYTSESIEEMSEINSKNFYLNDIEYSHFDLFNQNVTDEIETLYNNAYDFELIDRSEVDDILYNIKE